MVGGKVGSHRCQHRSVGEKIDWSRKIRYIFLAIEATSVSFLMAPSPFIESFSKRDGNPVPRTAQIKAYYNITITPLNDLDKKTKRLTFFVKITF